MSFFSKAAAFAKVAADATAKAANTVAEETKKAYAHATAVPTTLTCQNADCKTILAIPAETWAWTCSQGHINANGNACGEPGCEAKKEGPAPQVQCAVCSTLTSVPSSNATKLMGTVVTETKKGVNMGVEYTKRTYAEMSARPTEVQCGNEACKIMLAVPAEVWPAPPVEGDAVATEAAATANPQVTCATCGTATKVYSTVAAEKAKQGAVATKTAAASAVDAGKKKYEHYSSKPEEFNCANCNAKLMVPGPNIWMCQTAGCGTNNTPDTSECSVCKQTHKPKVMCGVCNKITGIPENNFFNSVRSTKLSAEKGAKDIKDAAVFAKDHKEDIKAVGKLAQNNPELVKAAAGAANTAKV